MNLVFNMKQNLNNMEKKIIGFKLIKQYPKSPKIGFQLNHSHDGVGGYYWSGLNGVYTEAQCTLLQDYSEFWEPIYEKEKVIDLNEIIRSGKISQNFLLNQVKNLMKETAESTIDFVVDYLSERSVRYNGLETNWKEILKKKIK